MDRRSFIRLAAGGTGVLALSKSRRGQASRRDGTHHEDSARPMRNGSNCLRPSSTDVLRQEGTEQAIQQPARP